jgi:hypothetical protein
MNFVSSKDSVGYADAGILTIRSDADGSPATAAAEAAALPGPVAAARAATGRQAQRVRLVAA